MTSELGWAALTIWAVVNAVNLLQSLGFELRRTHGMGPNRSIGVVIGLLALPATAAAICLLRQGGSGWLGPAVFDVFVVFMVIVDYAHPVEFRSPRRATILVPYLVLFFGSIVLMGVPMFDLNRALWSVTVMTSLILVGAMLRSLRAGTG
ncbi:MAG: hypothetical protein WCI74_07355 [Actinomycetes bacterium]